MKLSPGIIRPSSTLMSHGMQTGRSPLRPPLSSRPPSCSMTTRRTKPMNSDTMTAAISADPSPDVVLQALLAHDLMAFTEFSFGVVRPGIPFKPNWHLEAVTYKLSQVAKGLVRRLIITLPPRTLKSLCASVALPAWFLGHYPWERVVVVSTSIDGTLTGLGGNLIIIDDPLKLGDAMSEAVRARVIEWYRSTLLSRGSQSS